jgi:uncharacterized protein
MNEKPKGAIMIVTAFIVAIAVFASASVFTYGLIKTRYKPNSITVTGSAKKDIRSDFVVWRSSFSRQAATMSDAYALLQGDLIKVKQYLTENGLTEKDYTIFSINTISINKILPNGSYSNMIEAYRLIQDIEVQSKDVDKITTLSRESTKLLQDGVEFQSYSPSYYYTKIADLKVDMLALATANAKSRAEKMAENSGSTLGYLRNARMGVFQITPINSNDVSDYGINDTSSLEKQIMSVVSCEFTAK